jgi:signal transduction histidine kinase
MLRKPKHGVEGRTLDLPGLSRGIIEPSPLPMAAVEGKDHVVRHINPSFCRLVGKKGEELIGCPFAKAGPEADGCISLLDRVSLTGKAEIYVLEKRFGSDIISWSCAVWPVLAADEKPAGLIIQVTDMTEATLFRQKVAAMNEELLLANVRQHELMEEELRKANEILEVRVQERTEELAKSQQRLQQLTSQLLIAQGEERKRVAVELHDGLLSELAAMKYLLEGKIMILEKGELSDPGDLKRVVDILATTMRDARRIMNNLHPSVLDELGLIASINWLSEEYQKSYPHIRVHKQIEVSEQDISEGIKVVIFRVLQEALNNFARHGRGDRVDMVLLKSEKRFHLKLRDNGHGFDVENAQKGVGLESMRERVELSGGEFQIESIIGQGTTIRAIWSC